MSFSVPGGSCQRLDARRQAVIAAEFEALPGTSLEGAADLGAVGVDPAEGGPPGRVEVDAGAAFVHGEGALAEVPLVGVVGEVREALATPPHQVVGAQEDVALASVAAGAATGAVEGVAGDGVRGGFDRAGQLGIEGERRHGAGGGPEGGPRQCRWRGGPVLVTSFSWTSFLRTSIGDGN